MPSYESDVRQTSDLIVISHDSGDPRPLAARAAVSVASEARGPTHRGGPRPRVRDGRLAERGVRCAGSPRPFDMVFGPLIHSAFVTSGGSVAGVCALRPDHQEDPRPGP